MRRRTATVVLGALVAAVAVVVLVVVTRQLAGEPRDAVGTRLPWAEIPQGVSAHTVDGTRVFIVRKGDAVTVFVAAATHLPGEPLWWCPGSEVFAGPMHGETYDAGGHILAGPATRELDRMAAVATADGVLLDPDAIAPGRPRSADQGEAFSFPGPFCPGHVE